MQALHSEKKFWQMGKKSLSLEVETEFKTKTL